MKSTTYESDFLLWSEQQAAALRTGNLAALDTEGLIEELESMGNSDRRALRSQFSNILEHLLKLQFSNSTEPHSKWMGELRRFRMEAHGLYVDEPGIVRYQDDLFAKAWKLGLEAAEANFRDYKENVALPRECPYTIDQVLDYSFIPRRSKD